jgi:hypothetical protein
MTGMMLDGNPKTAEGHKKTPFRLLPTLPLEQEARVFELGAAKYGAYNWRTDAVSFSTYYEAAIRHLHAAWAGEETDPESGQSHLAHVRACMAIIMDAGAHGKLIDDRPPRPALQSNEWWKSKEWIAATSAHDSDCAVNNAPAYRPGPCNCSLSAKTV